MDMIPNELLRNGMSLAPLSGFPGPKCRSVLLSHGHSSCGRSYVPLDKKVGMKSLAMMMKKTNAPVVLLDTTTLSDYGLLHTKAKPIDVLSLRSFSGSLFPIWRRQMRQQ